MPVKLESDSRHRRPLGLRSGPSAWRYEETATARPSSSEAAVEDIGPHENQLLPKYDLAHRFAVQLHLPLQSMLAKCCVTLWSEERFKYSKNRVRFSGKASSFKTRRRSR